MFPHPDEVERNQRAAIEPVVEAFRVKILKVFETPANSSGTWWFDPISGLTEAGLTYIPNFEVLMMAFEIIRKELQGAGWVSSWRTQHNEHSVSIWPAKQPGSL